MYSTTSNHSGHSLPLRWLYVDFNSYFASVEQQLNPALRGKPVAVVPVETDSTSAIAASYEAKAYGIKTGTPIYEAKARCPELICVMAKHDAYIEFHHRIIEEVNRHIPVSLVCSIDEVACELMQNEQSVAAVSRIAQSIKAGLRAHIGEAVRCSIGVAPNRYLAKIATDLRKPDGFSLLPAESLPGPLLTLELKDFPGIGHNMYRRLIRHGVTSAPALWQLSAKQMYKIWGNRWGEKMWYMLRGIEVPEEPTTRSTIGHSHVLAPSLRPPPQARMVARRLTLKAASRLRRMGYTATTLTLSIRLQDGPRLECAMRCIAAQDSLTFLHMLEQMWHELTQQSGSQPIKKISVSLYGLSALAERQAELFDALPHANMAHRQKQENISHALDKINQRFGRDSVLIGMLPSDGRSFSGTKIAFTRIPDIEEFKE